jgi:hypothetical protein
MANGMICATCRRPVTCADAVAIQVGTDGAVQRFNDLFVTDIETMPVPDKAFCSWACWPWSPISAEAASCPVS